MRLLLDTHVVLWHLAGGRAVSGAAQEAIEQATELLFSVVSFAEIGIKVAVGKLSVPDDLQDRVVRGGLTILALTPGHGLDVAGLPVHHRDPFDRLLIAQARAEHLTLISADRRFAAYDVALVDAG